MLITKGQIRLGNFGQLTEKGETSKNRILYSRCRAISIYRYGAGLTFSKLVIRYHGKNVSRSWQISQVITPTSHISSTTT